MKDLNCHAAGARRFIKLATGWLPTDVKGCDGRTVIDSVGTLKAETSKYKELWAATECPCAKSFAANTPCDRIPVYKLRRVARTFKRRAGVAPDGWHPIHFSLLSDEGLETLSELYEFLELCGHLPHQQEQVFIFLIDKLTGGTQPIGRFTSHYRVSSKSRQDLAAEWAGRHDRPFFAAGKNRSTWTRFGATV